MCTYIYLYILCIFIQSNILAENVNHTSMKRLAEKSSGGAKGQLNTVLHGYSSLHYYGTGDKAQYSRMFDSFLSTADL